MNERGGYYSSVQPDIESSNEHEILDAGAENVVVVDSSRFGLLRETFRNYIRPFSQKIALPVSALLIAVTAAIVADREEVTPISARDNTLTNIERLIPNPDDGSNELVTARVETEGADKPSVRAVYLVPADREVNPEYTKGIERAMLDVQEWYAGEIEEGVSFQLDKPIVETVQSGHNANWFRTNNPGDLFNQFSVNVWEDASALIPEFFNGDKWVLFIDADSDSGQAGAVAYTNSSPAILDGDYLRGLAGEFSPGEGQAPNTIASNIGTVAHEVGHTFGLEHPDPYCDPGPRPGQCNLLMTWSFGYPLVELTPDEKNMLGDSPFFAFTYRETVPDFQVEVRMSNLNLGSLEKFSINESAFMEISYPVDTGKIDISKWVESGQNSVGLDAVGLSESHTYGFEVYLDGQLAFEGSCGQAEVVHCDNGQGGRTSVYIENFTFEAPVPVDTPTPTLTSTSTELPTSTVTPTPLITPTSTPTEAQPIANGDVNCDDLTNSVDAALILQKVAGLIDDLDCEENADTNFDGTTSAIDAALILQLDAGIIDEFSGQPD